MVASKKGDGLRYRGKGQGGRAAGVGAAMPQQPQQAPAGPQVPGGDKGHGGASALLPEAWFELYMLASGAAQLLYFTGMYFKPADVPYHIHLPSVRPPSPPPQGARPGQPAPVRQVEGGREKGEGWAAAACRFSGYPSLLFIFTIGWSEHTNHC